MDHEIDRKHPSRAKNHRFGPASGHHAEPSTTFDDEALAERRAIAARNRKKAEVSAPEAGSQPARVASSAAEAPTSFVQQLHDFFYRNATWFLIAGFALLLLQDVFGTHGVLAMRRSQKEADAVQKEIQQLSDENQQLQNRVQSLKTDPATIERIAREEMGLARPGEYIFKIQRKPGEPSTPLAGPAEPASPPRPKKR